MPSRTSKPTKPKRRRLFLKGILLDNSYVFGILSSDGKARYETTYRMEPAYGRCTCPGGSFGNLCKHLRQAVCRVQREIARNSSAKAKNRATPDKPQNGEPSTTMKQISETQGNIGPCRFSYMNVFTPRLNRGQNGKPDRMNYDCVFLIPKAEHEHQKKGKAEMKLVSDMTKAAASAKFGKDIVKYKLPYGDGDEETNAKGEKLYPGYWFVKASSGENRQPKLIDGNKQPVTGGWESGDWGIAQLAAAAYDIDNAKGVKFYLNAIQFLYVDEHFGGASVDMDSFESVDDAQTGPVVPPHDPDHDPFSDDD